MHEPEPLTRYHPGPTHRPHREPFCGKFRHFAVVLSLLDKHKRFLL